MTAKSDLKKLETFERLLDKLKRVLENLDSFKDLKLKKIELESEDGSVKIEIYPARRRR